MRKKTYGLMPVKLTEIPLRDRLSAARRVARNGDGEPAELIAAAIAPSNRVYWVRAQALGELPVAA